MFGALARKLFGTPNLRALKGLQKSVDAVNALEPAVAALTDSGLRERTEWLRQRVGNGESLDAVLPDAFATVREGAKRTLGQRHFDVQLLGGMVLHQGKIAEMKTGEGKTLVATLAVYLNALERKGVHVITVNDYLAHRDSQWMGQIYEFLGLSVGCIVHGLSDEERRAAYAADVTYGTNNEFGFDYLRDNMKFRLDDMVQRPFNFAIVDEVDSILIDEARTPLIISGPSHDSSDLYATADRLIPRLTPEDYEKDEKHRAVNLTELGSERIETWLRDSGMIKTGNLYDIQNVNLVHHVNQALRAHQLFQRDRDYIIKDGKVVIIDEFTGRMMEGRRYSDGLHQALEAKERVPIQRENQTLASITFQNYFRLYPKLAGMTGTALTEATEFQEIYNLDVIDIPTHVVVARIDHDDEVYRRAYEKDNAILDLIADCHQRKQPILVGTVSIEKSEALSTALRKRKVPHSVLNARYHEQEAQIIAQAGQPGAVTIATNMAGRGTDIQLGGNVEMRVRTELKDIATQEARAEREAAIRKEVAANREIVLQAGGLYVLGTERHEARRIDNQLRGRSGRQGDPGASKFFLSLEDDLMRIFGSDRIDGMLEKLGLEEGEAIVHTWINKALERAQKKVEAHNFEIRKNLLKYDNVMNDQRKVIYEQRREIMAAEEVAGVISDMRHEVIQGIVSRAIPANAYVEKWDLKGLHEEVRRLLGLDLPVEAWGHEEGIGEEVILERVVEAADRRMAEKAANFGPELLRMAEKGLLLQLLDHQWKDHLLSLDHLRQGINLRAYGQRDPLNEYKREAFELFETMLSTLRESLTQVLMLMEIRAPEPEALEPALFGPQPLEMRETRFDPALVGTPAEGGVGAPGLAGTLAEAEEGDGAAHRRRLPVTNAPSPHGVDPRDPGTWGKVARNAACPCGSGKKFKHCHGRVA